MARSLNVKVACKQGAGRAFSPSSLLKLLVYLHLSDVAAGAARLLCDPGCVETFCVQGGSVVTETTGLSCSPLPLSHLIAASCETL